MKRILYLCLMLILLACWPGWAADVKISALPAVTSTTPATDVIPIVASGATSKITVANFLSGHQVDLSLLKGTFTNGYICKYTATGTLLDCNTDPAGFQTYDAKLAAIATLANGAGVLTNDGSGNFSYGTPSTVTDTDSDGAADLANYMKSTATTGKISITGPAAGSTRAKTVSDADDTILELGGSYTPTGTWVWTSATVTWPTFNQNTTGTAANLSSVLSPTLGGTGVANNVASTITISGAFGITWTISADTSLTLPTGGTVLSDDGSAWTDEFVLCGETTAGEKRVKSCGAKIDLSTTITQNINTTGNITGAIKTVTKDTEGANTITAVEALGHLILLGHVDAISDLTLPDYQAAAAADHVALGYSVCVFAASAYAHTIHPSGDDKIRTTNGTLNAAGAGVTYTTASTPIGGMTCFILTDSASDVGHWTQTTAIGTWPIH